jgi:hypothetical protein
VIAPNLITARTEVRASTHMRPAILDPRFGCHLRLFGLGCLFDFSKRPLLSDIIHNHHDLALNPNATPSGLHPWRSYSLPTGLEAISLSSLRASALTFCHEEAEVPT